MTTLMVPVRGALMCDCFVEVKPSQVSAAAADSRALDAGNTEEN